MRTLVRTFHIEEELDRKMAEAVFRSSPKRLTKTQIVNDALRRYFRMEPVKTKVDKNEAAA